MARTNKQTRAYIRRLVEIKGEMAALNKERAEIGQKLGDGTHRSWDLPGLLVRVSPGSCGFTTSWKAVCQSLCDRYGLSMTRVSRGHAKRTHRSPTVAVCKDPAKQCNLKKGAVA